jgi:hypothetical protein
MDPVRNPFVPGAGTPPPELSGREDILERARVTLARIQQGRSAKSFLLVGLRGVGKTVLLNKIQEMAEDSKYKAFMIEAHENKKLPELLIPCLRQVLFALDRYESLSVQVRRGLRVLKSFAGALKVTYGEVEVGLDIDPETGAADSGDLEADLPELFLAVAQAAAARQTAVAIIIDELQYLSEAELSALIMAIHKVSQRQLPLVLIGAGLPQLVGLSGRSKSYAERLFDYPPVGALNPDDARAALVEPVKREGVTFEDDALATIISLTEGYPYFLQEWGYHSWNLANDTPITKSTVECATKSAIKSLDQSFFRVRFDRLTPREKDYMYGMARLGAGPHRSGDIAIELSVKVNSVAPVRSSLISKGMVYSPAHGDTAFTVPLFDQYLRRTLPDSRA